MEGYNERLKKSSPQHFDWDEKEKQKKKRILENEVLVKRLHHQRFNEIELKL